MLKMKKKLIASVVAVLLMMVCFGITSFAAGVPTKIHAYVDSTTYTDTFTIGYKNKITNLKTGSSNLLAKVTYLNHQQSYEGVKSGEASIQFYAKKAGTYKVSFNICNKDGEKISSKKITVYANNDTPIKKITVDGKVYGYNLIPSKTKSVKVKVALNKGYTLKKLEYGKVKRVSTKEGDNTVRKDTVITYVPFKNGGKVPINRLSDYYSYEYSYDTYYSHHMNDSLMAYTQIKITYVDKYTKKTESTTYSLRALAK